LGGPILYNTFMTEIQKKAQALFGGVWSSLIQTHGATIALPKTIIWFGGAPGAGKGTHWKTVAEHFGITTEPVVMSSLLKSPEMKKIMDSGKLVDDASVTECLFAEILKPQYAQGAIIDGFPRTEIQAEVVKLFFGKAAGKTSFGVVILTVNEATSVERQLGRAREDQAAGKPVRATDLDPVKTAERYRVFLRDTVGALKILSGSYPHMQVDGSGKDKPVVREEMKAALAKAFPRK
jgi:adenylate kinase